MKGVQIKRDNDTTIVVDETLDKPSVTDANLLIRVHAAGIIADELCWPESLRPGKVPGHEISGIVSSIGPGYNGPLVVGDEVFAMLGSEASQGGQAEYATLSPAEVALKPKTVSHTEAAALPISLLTAWEGLFTHGKLAQGGRILVTGASGAVGRIVVQLASRMLDADVIALASASKHAQLRGLGAARCVDYAAPGWEDGIDNIDVVFDTVGGSVLQKCWTVFDADRGGVLVTVADPAPPWAFGAADAGEMSLYPNVKPVYFIVTAAGGMLGRIGMMVDEGLVEKLPVNVFDLNDAAEAWEYAKLRGRGAKSVIRCVPTR